MPSLFSKGGVLELHPSDVREVTHAIPSLIVRTLHARTHARTHALCSRYIAASLFVERFCCEFLSFVSPIVASFSVSFYASYAFFSISFSIYCPSLYSFLFGTFGTSFCIRCPTSYAILFIALRFYLVLFSSALFFFRFVVHTSSLYMFRTWSCFFVYRFAFNVLFSSGFCSSCPAFSQRASLSSCFVHRDFLRFILHWIVFYMFCI